MRHCEPKVHNEECLGLGAGVQKWGFSLYSGVRYQWVLRSTWQLGGPASDRNTKDGVGQF